MLNWWFGILGIPLSNDPFRKGILSKPRTQTTNYIGMIRSHDTDPYKNQSGFHGSCHVAGFNEPLVEESLSHRHSAPFPWPKLLPGSAPFSWWWRAKSEASSQHGGATSNTVEIHTTKKRLWNVYIYIYTHTHMCACMYVWGIFEGRSDVRIWMIMTYFSFCFFRQGQGLSEHDSYQSWAALEGLNAILSSGKIHFFLEDNKI